MDNPKPSDYVDIRRFSYSMFAYVYKDYYTSHTPPPYVRLDYDVPTCDVFSEAMGACLLRVNKRLAGSLSAVCDIVVDHIKHSEDAFTSYLNWRSEKLNFNLRCNFLSMCSLISHLVLHYFKNGCFRFSSLAAEALVDIIRNNKILSKDLALKKTFNGFEQYCTYFDIASNDKENSSRLNHHPEDFKESSDEFPEDLLDLNKKPIIYGRPKPAKTTGEGDSNTAATSASQRKIVLITPKQDSPSGACAETVSPPKFSLFKGRRTRSSPGGNYACKFCRSDCRDFLKVFIDEFKEEYC